MNPDTLTQMLQKGFRVTLGATASLIEILQNPQRRDENLSNLATELSELSEEWAVKGEMTEQEARSFVENLLSNQAAQPSQESSDSSQPTTVTVKPTAEPSVQSDIKELTEQLAKIRSELEKLREQDGSSQ
ncbi:MAG: hypothetical protein ACFE0I_04835 [Elainellaceae cyanobacterium]